MQALTDWQPRRFSGAKIRCTPLLMRASLHSARLPDGAGGYRDFVVPVVSWRSDSILDVNNDFASGSQSGSRFIITTDAQGGRRVRVFTDKTGDLQAFLTP